jgi:iron uptake system EfeUOB component EfeO/EfeM
LKVAQPGRTTAVYEPGLNRHEWESEWETLEDDLRTDPAQALPELDRLVSRMLEETGYDLTDPVDGEDREVIAEYVAAHDVLKAVELESDELSPGDIAAAVNGYRSVFDHLIATRAATDADIA